MPILAQLIDDVMANKFELKEGSLTMGRHPECDVTINDIAVSGIHAVIETVANPYLDGVLDVFIVDQNSTNGTFVNDLPVTSRQRLNNNDIVRLAWNKFQFIENTASTLEATAYALDE